MRSADDPHTSTGDLLWTTTYPPSLNPDLQISGVDPDDQAVYVGFATAPSESTTSASVVRRTIIPIVFRAMHDSRELVVETVRASGMPRRVAQVAPGLLFVLTVVDDPVFGGLIVAAELAFGTPGLLLACCGFVVLSTLMAASTAWALRCEPIRLSAKNRERITALQHRRLGRHLLPHPERPVTTVVAAVVFGSVAPIIVAGLEPSHGQRYSRGLVLTSGLAYGVAFASGYGLLGAAIGAVA